MPAKPLTVEAYLRATPEPARTSLIKVRAAILAAAPHLEETISYGQPTFKDGPGHGIVAIAAFKTHCSLFPMSATLLDHFAAELGARRTSKGTIQFPLDKPLAATLVKKIVKARLAENAAIQAARAARKTAKRAAASRRAQRQG